ncbi:RNA polymerase sigma-70 factor, ECF subfamily [Mucilaginibacter sp. OK268]|uniref:sigma-70 family RNA polymerase sigma factor n=1 Tax=Mucilaginibacter sp. OK268 TaxID=1881048 RepID=UPI0008807DF4|nr:sigma-70 family RNA polymerase sigma factor [Mucilaginibacter sp. OK268]SDP07373.1 RNA polymerase sigma-70 factor, ECF subfamily [Mucilaginibacter sp. OK268]
MQAEEKRQFIEKVYGRFWKELYVVAYRRLQSEQDVEDILQDIFLSLLTGDVILDNDESVRAFLHRRLKSRVINFFRKQLLTELYEEQELTVSGLSDTDSETRLMSQELEAVVQEEIDRMPEKMKQIFLLSRNEFLTSEEIATRLNLSNQTVRNQISSAIKRIRATVKIYNRVELSATSLNILITISLLMLSNYK